MVRHSTDFDLNCLFQCVSEKPSFFLEVEEFLRSKNPQNSSAMKSFSCTKHSNSEIQQKNAPKQFKLAST